MSSSRFAPIAAQHYNRRGNDVLTHLLRTSPVQMQPLQSSLRRILALSLLTIFGPAAEAQTPPSSSITFKRNVLDTVFRAEGVAVGDFNHDGKMDIGAGTVWYQAPDWKMQTAGEKAPVYDPLNYSHAFQTFA